MKSHELRQRFFAFFEEKGHSVIPSASLIPENDPTVLFTTAGMHPLVPYLLGEKHPAGKRLASVQTCLRTDDIDEVGDNRHHTFFEMLGNWSLGDYFKREAITWSFEFLTSKKWLGLDPLRLYVTVFEGDDDAPRDEEAIEVWQSQFEMKNIGADVGIAGTDEPTLVASGPRIYTYSKKKNWWGPAGETGPCGPDTEMFYDTGLPHDPAFGSVCHPNCDCGRFVEIWNDVFMEYEKQKNGKYNVLKHKNVDTGMGLERVVGIMQGVQTVFDIDVTRPLISKLEELSKKKYGDDQVLDRSFGIVADHIKASVFIIGDSRGVVPSNIGQGYIARRLTRRAIREMRRLGMSQSSIEPIARVVIELYEDTYVYLHTNATRIIDELNKEEEKFGKTLEKGMRELEKIASRNSVTGEDAFILFSTYGFPIELTEEVLHERGKSVDRDVFAKQFAKHQELSRTASGGTFKGGLADQCAETMRLHTATHLLHAALRAVLGNHVEQRGSNITAERLRFDFSHPEKMTEDELHVVESMVNDAIKKNLPVCCEEMTVEQARARNAIGLFGNKYGEHVKVYTVGDPDKPYSREICGGPHVATTGDLGSFKILKEEAVSSGVRRIKAIIS